MSKHIGSFDGIRVILTALIFVNHLHFWQDYPLKNVFENIFHNGQFSVMLFFMISGFFYQYGLKYLKDGFDINQYKKYLRGKFLQLGVPYLLAEIAAFLFQIIRLGGHITSENDIFLKGVVLSLTMTKSWISTNFWGVGNADGWYISSLFLIYIIAPSALYLFKKMRLDTTSVFVQSCILLIINIVVVAVGGENNIQLLYISPFYRMIHFLAGFSMRMQFEKSVCQEFNRTRATIVECSLLVFVIVTYFVTIGHADNRWVDVIQFIPFVVLIYFCAQNQGRISDFLGCKLFRKLQPFCLYFYLCHYVIIFEIFGLYPGEAKYRCIGPVFTTLLVLIVSLCVSYYYRKVHMLIINRFMVCKEQ